MIFGNMMTTKAREIILTSSSHKIVISNTEET